MKIIRLKKNITVILNDGTLLTNNNCTDELYNQIVNNQNDDEQVKNLLIPEFVKQKEELKIKQEMLKEFNNSKYLSSFGNSVYIKSISELTVPEDLAIAFYKAEKEGNQELIDTYLNFWTLASLNPDSRARTNLFWFLKKYGMTISKSGLFIAYRNVELKKEGSSISSELATFVSNEYVKIKFEWKKSPKNYYVVEHDSKLKLFKVVEHNGKLKPFKNDTYDVFHGRLDKIYSKLINEEVSPTYTDSYTRKMRIKLGEPVFMDREECDSIQENTCSRGLHVAGKDWLRSSYFGEISLMVLVNPADVVAVPPDDNYGKMRTCAYYPVQIIQRDENGDIVDKKIEDGFEDDFLDLISYQGNVNNEDTGSYTINIPSIPELSRSNIIKRLSNIKDVISKKTI